MLDGETKLILIMIAIFVIMGLEYLATRTFSSCEYATAIAGGAILALLMEYLVVLYNLHR